MENKKIIDFDKIKMVIPPMMEELGNSEEFDGNSTISPREYLQRVAEEARWYQFDTNFYLTPDVVDYIEFTPGVQHLTIESPYSGTVEIGKMFDEDLVKHNIRKNINSFFFPKEPQPTKLQLVSELGLTKNQELPPGDGVNPE